MRKIAKKLMRLTEAHPCIIKTFPEKEGWIIKVHELFHIQEVWISLKKDGLETMASGLLAGSFRLEGIEVESFMVALKKEIEQYWSELNEDNKRMQKEKREFFRDNLIKDLNMRDYDKLVIGCDVEEKTIEMLKEIIEYNEIPF